VFTFSITYDADPSSAVNQATSTGTLTFNKSAGTYDITMQPLTGYTIVNTAGAGASFTGYQLNSSNTTNSQPPVTVASLAGGFFVQFSSFDVPGNGAPLYTFPTGPGDSAYVNGDVINGTTSWVSASGTAIGVAGDTMSTNEVLDFDFFTSNPEGFTNTPPSSKASGIYLKFDGIGSGEDLIVILKLVNTTDSSTTTKALYISNSDIIKGPGTGPGTYSGVALDNNDGLVIIEQNDYTTDPNMLIQGVQIITSEENLTGQAIDLNPAIGSTGGSNLTTTVPFSSDANNNQPLKISDIGFVTQTNASLAADLQFKLDIKDGDGDLTTQQTLNVSIAANTLMLAADPITGTSVLSEDQLAPVVDAAIGYWASQGVSNYNLNQLRQTDIVIGNLGAKMIGYTDGNSITIDDDAAGYGWASSVESVTPGKVDLLSALIHEYGHVLGYSHDQLGDELAVGERLLPLQIATSSQLF
jgi:hypothetical protein